jgi:hypothetical protein
MVLVEAVVDSIASMHLRVGTVFVLLGLARREELFPLLAVVS